MKIILIPGQFRWIGIALFVSAFVGLILFGMYSPGSWEATEPRRIAAQVLMLTGLLLLVLSKEKTEDEFINYCRLRAFRSALLAGMVYYIMDAVDLIHGAIIQSSFALLLVEIIVYLALFYIWKSNLSHAE